MFVAALIVLIIAVLLVIAALFGGADSTSIDMGAFEVEGPASLVFFAGMGTLLLFVLSLGMFRSARQARRGPARGPEEGQRAEQQAGRLQARRARGGAAPRRALTEPLTGPGSAPVRRERAP